MSLTRFDRFDPLSLIRQPFASQSVFDPFDFTNLPSADTFQPRYDLLASYLKMNRMDMWDAGDAFKVHAELPGISKDKVNVQVSEGRLIIDASTEDVKDYSNWTSQIRERRFGRYYRNVLLPSSVDSANVKVCQGINAAMVNIFKAQFQNGILELTIPKTAGAQGKRIEIK